MRFEFFDGLDSFRKVWLQKPLDKVFRFRRDAVLLVADFRPGDAAVDHVVPNSLDCFVVEWRHADDELVEDAADGPPVDGRVVSVDRVDHLWRHVIWSAHDLVEVFAFNLHLSLSGSVSRTATRRFVWCGAFFRWRHRCRLFRAG